jgi:predicted phage terminase large subunit-like protein
MLEETAVPDGPVVDQTVANIAEPSAVAILPASPAQKLHKTPTDPDGLREYNRVKQQESRERKTAKKAVESLKHTSKLEVTKKDALEILAQRVHNPHVREVCYELALKCAAATGLPVNRYLFAHGYQKLIESQQAKTQQFLEMDDSAIIPSEVIHQGDLYAIWDYSVSWREPDVTFSDFIEMRRILKSDWFELGQFLGIPFDEKPHRGWARFLPAFVPSLKPDYTLQDQREWLAAQKSASYPETTRDWLLQASRNTMKSTAALTLGAQAVLCAPSLRLLLVSETTKLSKDFIKAFRGFWELGSNPAYERFQYFFPEFCTNGDGSILSFTSPMRNFVLPQETAEPASVEVAAAGRRFDIAIFDDVISDRNTGTNEMRDKILKVYSALLKLREAGAGVTITLGTPWVHPPPGEIGDLYYELIERNKKDPEHPLAVMVQPAWILKPESAHLFPDHIHGLIEDHVQELTCPSRWPFKALMKEARADLSMFMSQNLCMYVESQESRWTPTFTLEELQAKVRPISFFNGFPVLFTCAAVDTAFSLSEKADRSSICIAKIVQYEGKNVAFITDVIVGRWRYSDLAVQIVEAFQRHGVQRGVIERNGQQWQDLQAAVQRNAVIRGYPLPTISWSLSTGTGTSVSAKVRRIKNAEILFNNGQVYFANAPWNEGLFAETVRFKGQRSGTSIGSKDDQVDSLGMLASTFLVKDTGMVDQTPDRAEFEQEMYKQSLGRAHYERMFGVSQGHIPVAQPTPDPEPQNPLYGMLGRFGMVRK